MDADVGQLSSLTVLLCMCPLTDDARTVCFRSVFTWHTAKFIRPALFIYLARIIVGSDERQVPGSAEEAKIISLATASVCCL